MRFKKISICAFALIILMNSIISMSAASDSWDYEDGEDYGSYVPRMGSLTSSFGTDVAYTTANFTLNAENVASIKKYNAGIQEGFEGDYAYLTVDISSVKDGGLFDKMDAYAIVSNLPDPKYDLESDYLGTRNEESEVVALGDVSAKGYYMKTSWNDLRTGGNNDSGEWRCQFAMSIKGVSDYNNLVQSSCVQAIVPYGVNKGQD